MTTAVLPRRRDARRRDPGPIRVPETALGAAVLAVLAWEAWLWVGPFQAGQSTASGWWYLPPAAAMLAGLLAARRQAAALRPGVVVALGVALALGFLAVHLSVGGPRDQDILELYPRYGAELLATGRLPRAEYPPLALLSFAAAAALGPVPLTLPLLTLPALAAAWWAVARSGPAGPWWAACAALLPTVVPFWEVKYDALPAALLALGLVAAGRQRWAWSGAALGLGAAAKWYPGLAVPVLAIALLRAGRVRAAAALAGASAAAFALPHLPFATDLEGLAAPYAFHAGRGITGESLPYLLLRPLGLADVPGRPWFEAEVPGWAPTGALLALAAVLVGVVATAAWRPRWALPLAAAAPVAFLLGNRIFSPQFLLPVVLATVAVGAREGAAAPRTRRRGATAFAVLVVVAATANYAVWPTASPAWYPLQVVLFASLIAAVATAVTAAGPCPDGPARARVGSP